MFGIPAVVNQKGCLKTSKKRRGHGTKNANRMRTR